VKAATGGRLQWQNIAADAFGNALGQGFADSMQPRMTPADIEDLERGRAMTAMAAGNSAAAGSYAGRLRVPGTSQADSPFSLSSRVDVNLVPDGMTPRLPYVDYRDMRARMTTVDGQLVDFEAFEATPNARTPTFVDAETGTEVYALGQESRIVARALPPVAVASAAMPGFLEEMRDSRRARYHALQDEAVRDGDPLTYVGAKVAGLAGDVGHGTVELAHGLYSLATDQGARQKALRVANYLVDRPETLFDVATDGINSFIRAPGSEKADSIFKVGLGLLGGAGSGKLMGLAGDFYQGTRGLIPGGTGFADNALRTFGDHLRPVLGPARLSHADEMTSILGQAEAMGIGVRYQPGRLAYEPALRSGSPGTLVLDADASIGALRHEWRHALDDAAMGHPGFRLMADSDAFWRLEFRGYMEEIAIARQTRYFDIGRQITGEMRARRLEILGR
jgi:hypothetical protein